jgi:TorA maturation chaperone TorD
MMINTKRDLQKTTVYRSRIYSFLSRLFREEVTKDNLVEMKKNVSSIIIAERQNSEGVTRLKNFFKLVEVDHTLIENLAADYAALFLGFSKYPAHPYESVYLNGENTIMSCSRNEVLEIFIDEGLYRADWFKEPEDHVALQFEFMSYLALELQKALINTDNSRAHSLIHLQYTFYTKHLKPWVCDFCQNIIASRSLKHDFYRAIGKITEEFMLEEKITIKQLMSVQTING